MGDIPQIPTYLAGSCTLQPAYLLKIASPVEVKLCTHLHHLERVKGNIRYPKKLRLESD